MENAIHDMALAAGVFGWTMVAFSVYISRTRGTRWLSRDTTDAFVLKGVQIAAAIVGVACALFVAIKPRGVDPAMGFLFSSIAANSLLSLAMNGAQRKG